MSSLLLRQIIYGLLTIPLSLVGLVGNMFCLLVLYPDRYKKTKGLFYGYLSVLAGADIVWLLSNIVFRYHGPSMVFHYRL